MVMDKSSPEFLFGQIIARLNEGDKHIQSLTSKVDDVKETLGRLPCAVHEERLKDVEEWQQNCNKSKVVRSNITLNFWHGVIIALSIIVINTLVSLFVQ